MATSIIGASTAAPTPREGGTVEFFTLNAKYLIDPSATAENLSVDLACFNGNLVAILEALVDATDCSPHSGLAFAALYQARQVSAVAEALALQRNQGAVESREGSPNASNTQSQTIATMTEALNEGANAHHALRATLDAMADEIITHGSAQVSGLYEAASASVEKLDRAMSRGLLAGVGQ